jgi:PQQ-like domain
MITINLGLTDGPDETWLYSVDQPLYSPISNNVAASTIGLYCAEIDSPAATTSFIATEHILLRGRHRYFPNADLYLLGTSRGTNYVASMEAQTANQVYAGAATNYGRTFRYGSILAAGVAISPSNTYYGTDAIKHPGYTASGAVAAPTTGSRVVITCGRANSTMLALGGIYVMQSRYRTLTDTADAAYPTTTIAQAFDRYKYRQFSVLGGQPFPAKDVNIHCSTSFIINSTALHASLVPVNERRSSEPFVFMTISSGIGNFSYLKPIRLDDLGDMSYRIVRPDPWPQYRQNAYRTARMPSKDAFAYKDPLTGQLTMQGFGPMGPFSSLTYIRRNFGTGITLTSPAAVGANGLIYVILNPSSGSGKLACLFEADLQTLWETTISVGSHPILDTARNIVIVGSGAAGIVAYDADDGTKRWTSGDSNPVYWVPVMMDEPRTSTVQDADAVYFTGGANVFAVSRERNGAIIWQRTITSSSILTTITLGPDRVSLFLVAQSSAAGSMANLHRFNRLDGSSSSVSLGKAGVACWPVSHPNNGNVYIYTSGLYGYNVVTLAQTFGPKGATAVSSGSPKFGLDVDSGWAYLPIGKKLASDTTGTVQGIDVAGTRPIVNYLVGDATYSLSTPPVVSADGTFYASNGNGDLTGFKPGFLNSNPAIFIFSLGGTLSGTIGSMSIGSNGVLLIPYGQYLYRVQGPANTSWVPQASATPSVSLTSTATPSVSRTSTSTASLSITATSTVTRSSSGSGTPPATLSGTAASTPTTSGTAAVTPSSTSAVTPSSSLTAAATPTASLTVAPSTAASSPPSGPVSTLSTTSTPSAQSTQASTPTATSTAEATSSATITPKGSPSVPPSPRESSSPSAAPTSALPSSSSTHTRSSSASSLPSYSGTAAASPSSSSSSPPSATSSPVEPATSSPFVESATTSASATASSLPTPSPTLTAVARAIDQIIASVPSQSPGAAAAGSAALPAGGSGSSSGSTGGGSTDPLTALMNEIVVLSPPSSSSSSSSSSSATLPGDAALLKLSFAPAFTTATSPDFSSAFVCNSAEMTTATSIVVPEGSTHFSSITVKLSLQSVHGYQPSSKISTAVELKPELATTPAPWLISVFEGIASSSATNGDAGSIFCVGRPLGPSATSRLVFSAPRFLKDKLAFDSSSASGTLVASFELNVTATLQLNASTATPWAEAELIDCAATISTLVAADSGKARAVVDAFGSASEASAALSPSSTSGVDKDPSSLYRTRHLLSYGITAWIWNALWSVPLSWYQAPVLPQGATLVPNSATALAAANNRVALDLLAGVTDLTADGTSSALQETCSGMTSPLESCFSSDERLWKPLSSGGTSMLPRLDALESTSSSQASTSSSSAILTGKTLLYGVAADLAPALPLSGGLVDSSSVPLSPIAVFSVDTADGSHSLLYVNSSVNPNGRYFALVTPSIGEVCPLSTTSGGTAGSASTTVTRASSQRLVKGGKPCPSVRLLLGFPSLAAGSSWGESAATNLCSAAVSDGYAASAVLNAVMGAATITVRAPSNLNAWLRRPMMLSCPGVCTRSNIDQQMKTPASSVSTSADALLPPAAPTMAAARRRNLLIAPESSTTTSSGESASVATFSALASLLSASASTWNANNISSASQTLPASNSQGFQYLRPCAPDRFSYPEAYALYSTISDAERLSICGNATDPRSEGSFGLCAWGMQVDCQLCPPGGVCRGGYSLQSRPGFFVISEDQLDYPSPCPHPATERCAGWSRDTGATTCGLGYAGARCAVCADGWYQDKSTGGRCNRCPATDNTERNTALAILSSVGIVIAATGGLTLIVGVLAIIVSKKNGGTAYGAIIRTIAFLFSAYDALQSVVQVANTAPPDSPAFLALVFNSLRKLQYQGISPVPLACTLAPPLLPEITIMGIALACIVVWFLAFAVWSFKIKVQRTASEIAQPTFLMLLYQAGYAGIIVASFLFALATNAVFTVLFDFTTISMTLSDYSFLDVDGSTAAEALAPLLPPNTTAGKDPQVVIMDILLGRADMYYDLNSQAGARAYQALLDTTFNVQTLTEYPSVVRFEKSHAKAYPLAVIAFIILVIGLPLVGYLLVRLLGINMVLERTRVPKILLTKGLPQISYGGATTAAVMAKERGIVEGKKSGRSVTRASSFLPCPSRSMLCGCCVRGTAASRRKSALPRRGSVARATITAIEMVESDRVVRNPLSTAASSGDEPAAVSNSNDAAQANTKVLAIVQQLELSEITEAQLFIELGRQSKQRQVRFISRGLGFSAASSCCSGKKRSFFARAVPKDGTFTSHGVGTGVGVAESPCVQSVVCGSALSRRALASLFGAGKRFTINPNGVYEPTEMLISKPVLQASQLELTGLNKGTDDNKSSSTPYSPSLSPDVGPRQSVVPRNGGVPLQTRHSRASFAATLAMENPLNAGAGSTTYTPAPPGVGRHGRHTVRLGSVASRLAMTAEAEEEEEGAGEGDHQPRDEKQGPVPLTGASDVVSPLRMQSWKGDRKGKGGSGMMSSSSKNLTQSRRNLQLLLGKPVDDEDNVVSNSIEVPLLGCPGCCVRRYDRRIQTPSDLLDSSEAIRAVSVLSYFTEFAGFRASRTHALLLNWALLIFLSAASTGDSSSGYQNSNGLYVAVSSLFLRGSLLFLFCALLAIWQIVDSPNALDRQWMSPVLAYIYLITGISSLYSSLATARSVLLESAASGGSVHYLATINGKQSLDSLGFIVAILCASLVPLLVVVFLLTMVKGAKKEHVVQEVKLAAMKRGTQVRLAEILTQQQGKSPSPTNESGDSSPLHGSASPRTASLGSSSRHFGAASPHISSLSSSSGDSSPLQSSLELVAPHDGEREPSPASNLRYPSGRATLSIRPVSDSGGGSGPLGTSLATSMRHLQESRTTAGVMMVRRVQTRKKL